MERPQLALIEQDLQKKMVFLTGPRQVGKTYLALRLLKICARGVYLNYDNPDDRGIISKAAWLPTTDMLVLDELHKMPGWKNYLKGIFDTIAELADNNEDTLQALLVRGGYPEPYLAENDRDADRWRMQYVDGLIRGDILDFERIHDLRAMQLTLELLRRRVGSPISLTALAGDVACAPNTIKKYLEILEALCIVFRVTPYHDNIARSLLKEPKVYFYDTGMVKGDDGIRFENLMAVHLLKHLHAIEDYQGKRATLHYLRTKEGKEVDFALAVEDQPLTLVEAKLTENVPSSSLGYFQKKYNLPAILVLRYLRQECVSDDIVVRRALDYLRELRL